MSIYNFHNPTFRGPDGQEDMPWLLTPGPVTTSRTVKLAALADWGSRDVEFTTLVADISKTLLALAGCDESYACVMLQGPGTYAVEAALGAFAPKKRKKTLVVSNGVYGERAAAIVNRLNRPLEHLSKPDMRALSVAEVAATLDADKLASHIWAVHIETTSGIVNPITDIGHEAKTRGRVFMVDAMASFGALPIDMVHQGIDVLVSTANKCFESLPGFSFVLAKRELLNASQDESHSLALDLYEQWQGFENKGQFRFTPPTHVLVAFRQALRELQEEGGPAARLDRYTRNADVLLRGLLSRGLQPVQDSGKASPIVQTFLQPRDPAFSFEKFHQALRHRGFAIYPGALTKKPSFRIGTIGKLDENLMRQVVAAIGEILKDMGVKDMTPEK